MVKGLTDIELRVLGCLLEKSKTTPDGYPLTLNSLCSACNQKTNREPVTSYSESTVQTAAESLKSRGLVSTRGGAGNSRVTKYSHRLGRDDRLFNEGAFDEDELAILTMMFLRGAQTLSELRTRTTRLNEFADLEAVANTIERLKQREDGPYTVMIERAPGQKEARYTHLCGSSEPTAASESPPATEAPPARTEATTSAPPATTTKGDVEDRLSALETQVADLTRTVQTLREALGET